MREIVEKLALIERSFSRRLGTFLLFAVAQRQERPELWDLLVCSPWASESKFKALESLSRKLRGALDARELLRISRVVLLDRHDAVVIGLRKAVSVREGIVELNNVNIFGLTFKKIYVITSSKSSTRRKQSVTWGQLQRILKARDIEILKGPGGERKLRGRRPDGLLALMRISHHCCRGGQSVVWTDYIKAIQRKFDIPDEEFMRK